MERNIDFVVPMVFPKDKDWRMEYDKYHGDNAMKNVRYRSWGTEELQVRCVMKFMPWVRRIYILLARESQVQPWMEELAVAQQDTQQEVRVVFHREFMPERLLPCFASPCIEMFLKDIPGLSEQFIYANDDMFPLSPLEPEDFFRRAAVAQQHTQLLPCQHITDRAYPTNPNTFQRKCMWQQNMIGKPFSKQFTKTYPDTGHVFSAILKSSCEEVWKRHGEEITKHLSPLKRNDHSANNWIYLLYQQYSGQYVDHQPPTHYTDHTTMTCQLAEIIRDPQAGIVCLNDNENIYDWKLRAMIAREEIKKKLRAI